jgi:hypothetical protein
MRAIISFVSLLSVAQSAFDCSFSSSYPRQYVAYHLEGESPPLFDGNISDGAWSDVGFTERFVDISTATAPKFSTHAKIRWDDEYLYVAAALQDEDVWANISTTCHCLNASQDQVIFHDNDFEIFVDADGSTHYYKEYEMNAANATWDLCLNKPYNDGGQENSSRVFGPAGWDYALPVGRPHTLRAGTQVFGVLNDPSQPAFGWSAEIGLPLSKLAENTSAVVPPREGDIWRINFSRVEWAVRVVGNNYWKDPACQSCPVPGAANEDNWVWSPQGSIAMHLPERWGLLQFARGDVNATAPVTYGQWPVRAIAAEVYYAQHAYAGAHNGSYAATQQQLAPYVSDPAIVDGTCTGGAPIAIVLGVDGGGVPRFNATVPPVPSAAGAAAASATIRDDRLITVN